MADFMPWDESRDTEWFRWCHHVEQLLQIEDLSKGDDGNGTDCYSIETAAKAFQDGKTPVEYAERCKAMMLARDRHEKMQHDRPYTDE